MSIKSGLPPTQALTQLRDILSAGGSLPPIIVAGGTEFYYIDRVEQLLVESYIPEAQRVTQMQVYFGPEVPATEILQAGQTASMFASRRLLVVREANQLITKKIQDTKYSIESLISDAPTIAPETTILLLYKDKLPASVKKAIDRHPDLVVLIESNMLSKDADLKVAMGLMAKEMSLKLDSGAVSALVDLVGRDLVTLHTELQKLALPAKSTGGAVSQEMVLQLVGMSREMNPYDLLRAVQDYNAAEATQIAHYMADNDKRYPLPMILAMLYGFFANLIVVHYMGNVGADQIAQQLKLKSSYQARTYQSATRRYSPQQTLGIISAIRNADVAFKGASGSSLPPRAIYDDLLAQIFTFRY